MPRVDLRWALPALLAFTASKAIHAVRWRLFLRHRPEVPTHHLVALFLVGNLVNALVPLRAGDLLRIELPSRRYHVPRAEVASSVLLVESLLDGVAFVLAIAGAVFFIDIPAALRPAVLVLTSGILIVFLAAVGAARGGRQWRLRGAVGGRVAEALNGMSVLRSTPEVLLVVALSCGAWLIEVTSYWMLAHAFGLELSYPETLLTTVVANMVVAVPLTPWNLGPYEVAVTELLTLLGASRPAASSFALGSHLLLMLWIGVTGVLATWALGLRVRDVARGGHAAASTGPSDAPTRH